LLAFLPYSNKKIGEYSQGRWHTIILDKKKINSRSVFLDSFACSIENNEKSSYLDGGFSTLAVVEAAYNSSVEAKEIKVLNQNNY